MKAAGNSSAAAPDFVLLGANGFLGAAILQALQASGHAVQTSRVRLQDRPALELLLDDARPSMGVVCAAGERGRPNISWCEDHPIETLDANITGQLNVAVACRARGLRVVLLGTGALYSGEPGSPGKRFVEEDPPNAKMNVYLALRQQLEVLVAHFDNVLLLRVLYPVSSDLDARGLLGKLARFERVDRVETSVTVLDDLCPLIPELVKAGVTGVLNFVNEGTASYAEIINEMTKIAPDDWRPPVVAAPSETSRPACCLDVARLSAACGREVPDASSSIRRLVSTCLHPEDFLDLRSATSTRPTTAASDNVSTPVEASTREARAKDGPTTALSASAVGGALAFVLGVAVGARFSVRRASL